MRVITTDTFKTMTLKWSKLDHENVDEVCEDFVLYDAFAVGSCAFMLQYILWDSPFYRTCLETDSQSTQSTQSSSRISNVSLDFQITETTGLQKSSKIFPPVEDVKQIPIQNYTEVAGRLSPILKVGAGTNSIFEDVDLGDEINASYKSNTKPNNGNAKKNGDNVKATGRLSPASPQGDGDKSKAACESNTIPNIGYVKRNGDNVEALGRWVQHT